MIYLASPYTSPTEEGRTARYEAVMFGAWKLMSERHHIYSPIVHCHELAKRYTLPTDFKYWQEYNHDFIDAAKQVWVLCIDGWEHSKGVRDEIDYAVEKGYPLHYVHVLLHQFNGERADELECFIRAYPPIA